MWPTTASHGMRRPPSIRSQRRRTPSAALPPPRSRCLRKITQALTAPNPVPESPTQALVRRQISTARRACSRPASHPPLASAPPRLHRPLHISLLTITSRVRSSHS
eukprot:scaffold58401_cov66-Phaeocystis_antarctica.AAC.3